MENNNSLYQKKMGRKGWLVTENVLVEMGKRNDRMKNVWEALGKPNIGESQNWRLWIEKSNNFF